MKRFKVNLIVTVPDGDLSGKFENHEIDVELLVEHALFEGAGDIIKKVEAIRAEEIYE